MMDCILKRLSSLLPSLALPPALVTEAYQFTFNPSGSEVFSSALSNIHEKLKGMAVRRQWLKTSKVQAKGTSLRSISQSRPLLLTSRKSSTRVVGEVAIKVPAQATQETTKGIGILPPGPSGARQIVPGHQEPCHLPVPGISGELVGAHIRC